MSKPLSQFLRQMGCHSNNRSFVLHCHWSRKLENHKAPISLFVGTFKRLQGPFHAGMRPGSRCKTH